MTIHTLLLFAQLAAPASTPVTTPTLGYTLVDHQIYAISGLPGAAAAAILPGLPPITSLAAASHAPAVIALPATQDAKPILITPTHRLELSIPGVGAEATLSPTAQYALLLTNMGLYRLQLGADLAPEAVAMPESPSAQIALTVSDFGAILVTTPTDLYYWSNAKAQPLHLAQALTSPRFAPHSNFIAALSAGPAVILMDPATGLTVQTLASERDGLAAPTALEFGSDNSIWVTQASTAPLLHVSLSTHSVDPLTYPIPALSALSPGVFLADPQHIFDTNRSTPTLLLLPAPSSTPANQ